MNYVRNGNKESTFVRRTLNGEAINAESEAAAKEKETRIYRKRWSPEEGKLLKKSYN